MKKALLLTSLFSTLATSVLALDLQLLPWNNQIASRKLAVAYGDKVFPTEDLALHPSKRSIAIQVPSDSENLRLLALDRPDENGKPAAFPIRLNSEIKKPLAIIVPDRTSKLGVRAMVLDDNLSNFKWGTMRILNITNKELLFRWEKDGKVLKPGWNPTEISPGGATRNMQVTLHSRESGSEPIYSSIWEHRDDMRKLVFLFPSDDQSRGPVEFKIIPERQGSKADS